MELDRSIKTGPRIWLKRKWERVTLAVCGVLILVMGVVYLSFRDGLWTHFRIGAVEAEYRKTFAWSAEELRDPLSDSDNAAYFMRNALLSTQWSNLIDRRSDIRKAIRAGDFEAARNQLADYQSGLPRLDKASRMDDFALVREWDWGRYGQAGLIPFTMTVDLLYGQGLVECHDRKFDSALERAETLDRYAGLFAKDLSFDGQLGALLALSAADEIRGQVIFDSRGAATSERTVEVHLDLAGAWRGESYSMLADARNMGDDPEGRLDEILDRERMQKVGTPVLDYSETGLGKGYQVRVMEASLEVDERLREIENFGEAIAFIGEYEVGIPSFPETKHGLFVLFPDTTGIDQTWRMQQVRERSLPIVRQAMNYRNANGKWPGSLSELNSVGPASVIDWMNVRIKQSAESLVVYSPGVDGVDEGGSGDDLVAFKFEID